jgi:hypothetical protein
MNDQQVAFRSLFGKLPYEQEKEIVKNIISDVEEFSANIVIPFVVVDKEVVMDKLRSIKRRLDELGV